MKRSCLVLAILLAAATSARASDQVWDGTFSGDWFLGLNWDLFNGPPNALETAIFRSSSNGLQVTNTNITLGSSTIVANMTVESPLNAQYTFTGSNGATVIVGGNAEFTNSDFQALNVTTWTSLGLSCDQLITGQNAVLSISSSTVQANLVGIDSSGAGRIELNSGAILQSPFYTILNAAGELRINSGGEMRVTGNNTLVRGTTTLNSGGQLTISSGVTLEFNTAGLFKLNTGYGLSNGATLKATAGGDITSTSFIDIGNTRTGTLLVDGSGSTFTALSTCDWGFSSSGNSTVTISTSAVATVSSLRAGTSDAKFVGSVASSATLHATFSFSMGGGTVSRQVSLGVSGGTFQVDGSATFNNMADLTLSTGTVTFNGGATFNSGSRFDWSGGTLNLGSNTTLLVDGGIISRTFTTGFAFTNGTTLRLRNNASFLTPSFFDLQDATLDLDNSGFGVGTTNGTISDWGSFSTTTVTLSNNAGAGYNALEMSAFGGTTNVTLSSGGILSAGILTAGGGGSSQVALTINGGTLQSAGTISLLRGTTATVNALGKIQAADLVIGSSFGAASLTVTGSGALAQATNSLTVAPGGSLSIHSSGAVTPGGATTLNAGSSLFIDTAGSLSTNSLNATTASLSLSLSGTINTSAATILNSGSTLSIDSTGDQNAAALTTGTFTSSGSTLSFSFSSHVSNIPVTVSASNGLTIHSMTLQVTAPTAPLGSYDIIRYAGQIQGAGLSAITLPPIQNNIAFTVAITTDGLSNFITLHKGYLGDTNDDGIVNLDDYLRIDQAFLLHTPNPTWFNGDFNTDGVINGIDYAFIDFAFQHPPGPMAGLMIQHAAEFGDPYLATLAALGASVDPGAPVPEPSSVCLLAFAATALLRRQKRPHRSMRDRE